MRFNFPLVAFFLAVFVSARPVELLHSREELRMLSRAHDYVLLKRAEIEPIVDPEEWALLKRENTLLTQLMTSINQSGLAVTFIKTFTESPVTQPTVIDLAENFLKAKNLTTILSSVDKSGLALDVVVLFLTNYNVFPGVIKIAEGITGVGENSGGFLGSILGDIFGFGSSGGNSTATGGIGQVLGDVASLLLGGSSSSSSSGTSSTGGLLGGLLGGVSDLLGGLFGVPSSSSSSSTSATAAKAATTAASTLTGSGSDFSNPLGFLTDFFPAVATSAPATTAKATTAATAAATSAAATSAAATSAATTSSSLGGLFGGLFNGIGNFFAASAPSTTSSSPAAAAAATTPATSAAPTAAGPAVPVASVPVAAVPAVSAPAVAPAVAPAATSAAPAAPAAVATPAAVPAKRDLDALSMSEKRDAIDPVIQQVLNIIVSDATVDDVIVSLKKSGLGVSAIRQLTTDSSEFAFVDNLVNQLVGDGVLSFSIVIDAAFNSGLLLDTAFSIITSSYYIGLVIDFVLALFEGKIAF